MPRITHEQTEIALAALTAAVGHKSIFHLRGAGQNKLVLVEAVEPDLERRISPELDKPEMLVFMDAYGRGFARGASDGA